ncbi:MAG: hypothetical protein WCW77_02820 [Patescibacteria group bacterium]|jgi:hypothetical protein
MKKNLVKLLMIVFLMLPVLSLAAMPALAATEANTLFGLNTGEQIGLGNTGPKDIIVNLVQVALGFLGIIAVIIILIGGFKWMTAQGNDDKVAEARKLIQAGIIGLVIILAAWGITYWVIQTIWNVT